jgi:hypothetical protein
LSSANFCRPGCGCDGCWATAAPGKPKPIDKPITKAVVMRKICAIVMKRLVGWQAHFLLFALAPVC